MANTTYTKSELERTFDTLWRQIGGPELDCEIKFHPTRRWRIDRGIKRLKIGIEVQGGTWVQGGHSRGAGYTRDCIKSNAAQLLGWRLFQFTTDMLTKDPYGHLMPVKRLIESELE